MMEPWEERLLRGPRVQDRWTLPERVLDRWTLPEVHPLSPCPPMFPGFFISIK